MYRVENGRTLLDTGICFVIIPLAAFLSSSMAEHAAVNRRVVGSSPT